MFYIQFYTFITILVLLLSFVSTGSPVKAEALPCVRSDTAFDPCVAPIKCDKNAKLYSLMVNYVYQERHDINLRYMFPKADIQTAVLDHDYTAKPYTHYWIEDAIKVCGKYLSYTKLTLKF